MYALFLKFYFLESIVFCDICCTLNDLVVIQYLQSKDDSDDSSDESDEEPALKKPKVLNFWCLLFHLKILVSKVAKKESSGDDDSSEESSSSDDENDQSVSM